VRLTWHFVQDSLEGYLGAAQLGLKLGPALAPKQEMRSPRRLPQASIVTAKSVRPVECIECLFRLEALDKKVANVF
jgi:hypothetical protein